MTLGKWPKGKPQIEAFVILRVLCGRCSVLAVPWN